MSKIINDDVFGKLLYDFGWKKEEKVDFWGREFNILITLRNFEEEPITVSQKNAYCWLKDNMNTVMDSTKIRIKEYLMDNYANQMDVASFDNLFKVIIPRNIIFNYRKDEKTEFAILFDFKFDLDNGLAVEFINETISFVGEQDGVL